MFVLIKGILINVSEIISAEAYENTTLILFKGIDKPVKFYFTLNELRDALIKISVLWEGFSNE